MANAPDQQTPTAEQKARRCLYVGAAGDSVAAIIPNAGLDVVCERQVAKAIMLAASASFDIAIIDQRGGADNARSLMIAALAAGRRPPRVVVLAEPGDIGSFLRMPGVRSVLATPLRREQLRSAIAAAQPVGAPPPETASIAAPVVALASPEALLRLAGKPTLRHRLISTGPFMALVSSLYKNAAFALLATLFLTFVFYGFLIVYFLLANGWGAPVTLSKGHELVVKVDHEIATLQVAINTAEQRLIETQSAAATARRAQSDAALMVTYVKGTVDQEIAARLAARKTLRGRIVRLGGALKEFETYVKGGGMQGALDGLYRKRLIDRQRYDAGKLGLVEANQRLAGIQGEIDAARDEDVQAGRAIDMLTSLRDKIAADQLTGITAATADVMALTKQAVEVQTALDQASSQMQGASDAETSLRANLAVMREQLAGLEESPLGRARMARVDVIFVPYGNEQTFVPGAGLYSCALTVIFCHRAGTVGAALPGESNAIHPFFGKPLRGFFVEAKLDDPAAAAKEIIHAGRPPFFF